MDNPLRDALIWVDQRIREQLLQFARGSGGLSLGASLKPWIGNGGNPKYIYPGASAAPGIGIYAAAYDHQHAIYHYIPNPSDLAYAADPGSQTGMYFAMYDHVHRGIDVLYTVSGVTYHGVHIVRSAGVTFNSDGDITLSGGGSAPISNHNLLDGSVHPDTVAAAVARGALVVGNATPKWDRLTLSVPAVNILNVLGVANGETDPSWKGIFDGTAPSTIGIGDAASAGTSLLAAHRDHVHGSPSTYTATAHNLLSATHGDTTAAGSTRGDIVTAQGASPKWARLAISVPAANVLNVLGVANGDTESAWKVLFDATAPSTIGIGDAASAGTALTAAHRDHIHGSPSTFTATAHNLLSATHGDTLADSVVDGDVLIGNVTPKWSRLAISVPAANVRNVFGIDNGETRPSWKTALDATAPTTISESASASAGTSLVFSHRDHTHGSPATYTATAHNLLSAIHGDTTTGSATRGDIITAQGASPKWVRLAISVPAANVLNVLGVANGDTESAWKVLFDSTAPSTIGVGDAASAGTSLSAAHRDHVHGSPSTYTATAHNILSATHGDALAGSVADGDVIIGNVTPKWSRLSITVPAANVRNVFGVDNGETRPSWKTALDATAPSTIGIGDAASAGTSLVFSHRDHVHGSPSTYTATAHNLLSAIHGDTTAASVVRGDVITGQGASPKWVRLAISVPAANVLNVLGVANGDTEPAWKVLFDSTNPAAIGTVAPGTSLSAAHRDHVHALTTATLAGTTNQVNLSASGTGVLVGSTNITLSLPQDIHTSATPQFAQLGVGIAAQASTTSYVFVSKADTSWGGMAVNANLSLSATSSSFVMKGMFFQAYQQSNVSNLGDNTANPGVIAVQGTAGLGTSSAVNLTGAVVFDVYINNGGSGVLTNGTGISLRNPVNTGGGSITSYAAYASNNVTTATNFTLALLGTLTIPTGKWSINSNIGMYRFALTQTDASAANPAQRPFWIPASTVTLTGTTQVTSAYGVVHIDRPTITDASALTINNAASLYIANSPLAAGSVTLTNTYALWIAAGAARFDGALVMTGYQIAVASKSANYTLTDTDHTILVDASGGAKTMTLPTAAGRDGKVFILKKTDSSANAVTVLPAATQKIDGATSYALNTIYQTIQITALSSNWYIT